MEWILILYFAFNTGDYQHGGGGGIALDHIEFYTEEQCDSVGKQIMDNFNEINGHGIYTGVRTTITGRHFPYENRKYLCIHREDPNKPRRKK